MRLVSLFVIFCLAGCARGVSSSPLPAQAISPTTAWPFSSGFKTIFSFNDQNGANPAAALIAVKGTLYGTTPNGGNASAGTVFKIAPSGAEKVLHFFGGEGDGMTPGNGALILLKGELYGTTHFGGANGLGSVFKITTSGQEKIVYSFGLLPDGDEPTGGLTVRNGVLYGTTELGGKDDYGAVFRLTTSGSEKVLHSFIGGRDGQFPLGALASVGGALYGTTEFGGTPDYGTVFKISPTGTEKIIHAFGGTVKKDGATPTGPLTAVNGQLYGTTEAQGVHSGGTVFSITTAGKEIVLHDFGGNPDGANPTDGGLTDVNGMLYGTTSVGGTGYGTVFAITTKGKERVVCSFAGDSGGEYPYGGPVPLNGKLYGTTTMGGSASSYGTVYWVTPNGLGNEQEK
ncbi:MAG TPA: choice-of-anchor tandem repeat GloVer-containing protein [Candidatus Cybelea sp.]|nr:choice-of-anchor tandem repeat GloVer-containing protein [Candidatus Cybelea sp.]